MNVNNINARLCDNGAVFVQYDDLGKAKNAAFMSWADFITWLTVRSQEDVKPMVLHPSGQRR